MKIRTLLFFLIIGNSSFSQSNPQYLYDSLGLKGSTTIYDYNNKKWLYTDSLDANIETLPASTFKIINSLIALEYKAVTDENEIFRWDGFAKMHLGKVVTAWNEDSDLKSAYKNSTVWVYEEVAKRIGRSRYKKVLSRCNYGNGNLTEKKVDFWNNGEFGISPIGQITFLIKLFENRLPFSVSTCNKVKEFMISGEDSNVIYRDKTGWTRYNQMDIAWWVGYVQTKSNTYFFATRIIKREDDINAVFPTIRKDITKKILASVMEN